MAILCCRSFHVNLIFLILYFCTPFHSFTETFSYILSFDPRKNPMKQASRHVVLMYFTHERIKAYGSQCFTQVSRLISGISGCRTQISCLLVLCLLHNVTVLQVDPKLKHCSVDSFLVVGYKWYIILITYAYFQRKGFTLILCQCYFNV